MRHRVPSHSERSIAHRLVGCSVVTYNRQSPYWSVRLYDVCSCQRCLVHVTLLELSCKVLVSCTLCRLKHEAVPQRVMTGDGMLRFHPYFDVLDKLGRRRPRHVVLAVCSTVARI